MEMETNEADPDNPEDVLYTMASFIQRKWNNEKRYQDSPMALL